MKKKIPKEIKENQLSIITQKELDELQTKSSFFDKFKNEKNYIIDGIAHIIASSPEIIAEEDCPTKSLEHCGHYDRDCAECVWAHKIYEFLMN